MTTPGSWVTACRASDLEIGGVTLIRIAGRDYAIYDAPDQLYASLARCTHAGALLSDGYFDGHLIECPLHQGCFDIRTGAPAGAPAIRALQVFEVRLREGLVELNLKADEV